MKAIIAAKCTSSRVPDKNWRPFYKDKCLVEVKISQLIDAGFEPNNINVFCEDVSKKSRVTDLGAIFRSRDIETTKDSMHWSDVVTTLVSSLDCDEEDPIAWIQGPTPLFDGPQNKQVIDKWKEIEKKDEFDSIITVKEFKEFVIDNRGKPVNFNFGRWHDWSQDLPEWFILESPIHIMKKKTYLRCNYYIGERPYVYKINDNSIDIDYMNEFEEAQKIYTRIQKNKNNSK